MLQARSRIDSVTADIYSDSVLTLAPSIAASHPGAVVQALPGRGPLPAVAVVVGALRFVIRALVGRAGDLFLFPDGPMVLQPRSCSRLQALSVVSVFVQTLDLFVASNPRGAGASGRSPLFF